MFILTSSNFGFNKPSKEHMYVLLRFGLPLAVNPLKKMGNLVCMWHFRNPIFVDRKLCSQCFSKHVPL